MFCLKIGIFHVGIDLFSICEIIEKLLKALKGNIMRIGIPKERFANEARVAATPSTVSQLLKLGFTVSVERGAGHLAVLKMLRMNKQVRR